MRGFASALDGLGQQVGVIVEMLMIDLAAFDGGGQGSSVREVVHVAVEHRHEQVVEVLVHVRRLRWYSHSTHVRSCRYTEIVLLFIRAIYITYYYYYYYYYYYLTTI